MTRPNKYRAQPTVVDGIRFASKREAKRYGELKLLEAAGEIKGLSLQPKFPVVVNGVKVCVYIADFSYISDTKVIVEDVKSPSTAKNRAYRIKRKLVHALYPDVRISEV